MICFPVRTAFLFSCSVWFQKRECEAGNGSFVTPWAAAAAEEAAAAARRGGGKDGREADAMLRGNFVWAGTMAIRDETHPTS